MAKEKDPITGLWVEPDSYVGSGNTASLGNIDGLDIDHDP